MVKKRHSVDTLSHFQNGSPPHYGGIFDSSVRRKLSESEIPDFERERSGNFDHRNTKRISRIEIFAQRRDRPKWGVLKLALPSWGVTLFRPMILPIMIAGIIFGLPDASRGARNQNHVESTTVDRRVYQSRTPTVLMVAEKKSEETSTSREGTTINKKNVERWQNLPSNEKKELRKRMDKFQNLPPQDQDKYRRRNQKLQELTPSQRKKIDQGLEKGDALSPTEKEEIRRLLEE